MKYTEKFPSYPDPWNEGGKGVSEVGVLSEDMAGEEGRNGRTLHCRIEHQDQDTDIFRDTKEARQSSQYNPVN